MVEVAIVGTGGIAAFHAEALAAHGGRARIIAATDVDAAVLAAYESKWSVPAVYPTLDELLAQEKPDLATLCTPPGLHASQAVACLSRGISVLCEKPPVLSLAELDAVSAAVSDETFFATVFQHRFGSGAVRLRGLMGDDRLGRPLTAVCHTLWFRADEYFAVPWRGNWDIEGGGPTMGHGIHQFDLLLSILGEWREVVAVAARQAKPTDTEDLSCAIVTFASGAVATIVNSVVSPRERSYLRFDFEHASVELDHVYGYSDKNWRVTAAPGHESSVASAWTEGPADVPSGHKAQFDAVLSALESGAEPPVSLSDTRLTVELIAAIYASAFTGERIRRGELGPDSPFYHRMNGSGAPWN